MLADLAQMSLTTTELAPSFDRFARVPFDSDYFSANTATKNRTIVVGGSSRLV